PSGPGRSTCSQPQVRRGVIHRMSRKMRAPEGVSMKRALILTAALTAAFAAPVHAQEALAKKHNCLACHAVDKKLVGPSYKEVAAKYRGDKTADAKLFEKVKKGGV